MQAVTDTMYRDSKRSDGLACYFQNILVDNEYSKLSACGPQAAR